jgi:hypothetical protein
MKKYSLLVFFIFLMKFTSYAQESSDSRTGFYGSIGGGFGIGLCYYDPCDYYDEDYYPSFDNYKAIDFVPGRGFNVNLGAGYMFSKNIGVQLNVKDFFGLPIKQTLNNFQGGESLDYTESFRYTGMMLQVIPSVVLDLGFDKIDPYARFGMSIGAFPQIMLKKTEVQGNNTYEYVGKYKGNVPLGFSAAVGVKYNLNEHFGLFGEFDCNGINYSPKKYILTKYTENNIDKLSTLPLSQTEIDFVKSYDAKLNTNDSPTKQLKQTFPFSNFEINIGATYRF